MKKIFWFLIALHFHFFCVAQNIGINATGAAPAASAMLDIVATDKGLLIPRVALTATNAAGPVTSPATSLLVYNTATAGSSPNNVVPGYYYWNGTAWIALLNSTSSLNAWNVIGNSGTTAGTNFVGTTDAVDFVLKTNNSEKARITSSGNVGIGTSTFDGTNPERFLVNPGVTTSVNSIVGKGSINSYLQLNIQNQSTGTSASSDVVATSDNGSETTNFIDMGINGSTYTGGVMGTANDAYLYNVGQNLLIGTGTAARSLVFMTGGTAQAINERMRIDGSGNIGVGTNSPAFKLDVNGTIGTGKASTTNGSLVFSNSTNGNTITVNSGATTTSYAVTLPPVQGAASTVITNNGSGVLTWNTFAAASGGWSILGNTGTSSSTNFLGTTDNQALSFRVNNLPSGKIETSATANTAFGYQSSQNNTGTANTSFGSQTLQANTSGVNNTAFGSSSLKANLTGTSNTGIGASALLVSTGSSNTAVGSFAMQSNVGGSNNAAVGNSALSNNVSGTGNTAVGSGALQSNSAGINNTAIGNGAFQISTGGNTNTAIGAFSLQSNNLGASNSGLGYGALGSTVAGNNNTGLGYQSGLTNTSGGNNTFVGYQADATSSALTNATAVGYNAKVASSNSLILGGLGANTVNVGIGNNVFDGTNPEKLLVNAGSTSSVNILAGKGSINSYLQLNIQNQSTGTSASSDVVATADNGSETTNFIDMGINGSGYTAAVVGGADDAYLYNIGQNLLIGTGTAGKSLILVAGGTNIATSERLRIDGSTGNIGIGTTTPQARLDITSTTGGLLMPRMTTVQRDAIVSPPLSSYIFNTTTGFFNVYNGTGWKSLGYSSSSLIIVSSLGDLPAPAGGAITLDATKNYQFDGIIDLVGNYINLNGATVRGTDLGDGVMSSVSGAVLRSSGQNIFIQNFVVVLAGGSAKAYDFSDGTGLLSCVLQNANIADATPSLGVGQISGFNNVLIQNCGWQTADGIKLTGTMERFLFFGSLATNMTSGACIEFLSSVVINDVNIGQSNFENSSTALKLDAGASVNIGRVASCILRNVTTALTGFDSFTPGWEMTANSNIPNSQTYGYLYMNGNATATTFGSLNTYIKVAGTTTSLVLHKTSTPATNRLTYIGKKNITARVFIAISGTSPSTAGAISVALAKNGTVITNPHASLTGMSNNQAFQLVLDTEVDLVTNDFVEAFIANNTNTNSYTISALQFRIVD